MFLLIENQRFRLLWAGSCLICLGTWTFMMVHGWLTLTETDSSFWVGAATGSTGLGMVSMVSLGGVLADRVSRRTLIVGSGILRVAAGSLLAITVYSGEVHLWHILATSFIFGGAEGIRAPAFMAFIIDVVGRQRAMSANAANLAAVSIAGIIAPLVGAGIVTTWGLECAYLFIVSTEIVAAALLSRIELSLTDSSTGSIVIKDMIAPRNKFPWQSFKEGTAYVFRTPNVRTLILLAFVGESFGWAHVPMLPLIARDYLGVEITGLGYLQSSGFVGLFISTVTISNFRNVTWKGWSLVVGGAGFALFLILFSFSRHLPLSVAFLSTAYAFAALYDVCLTTLIQTIVPDWMRGRVLSFQAFSWGINGVSGFHMGAVAGIWGAPVAIAIGGSIMLANIVRVISRVSRL